ncbi:MAG: Uma2 family endonuclease [Archangium sp.]
MKKTPEELLAELTRLPDNMVGEVIDGELWTMGRPSLTHQTVEGALESELRRGGGCGASGWLIASEVELLFPSRELLVPDVVGWRREPSNCSENAGRSSARGRSAKS